MISGISSQNIGYVSKIANNSNESKIEKTSELKTDKLSSLSKQIENGEYKTDLQKTANAIVEELVG